MMYAERFISEKAIWYTVSIGWNNMQVKIAIVVVVCLSKLKWVRSLNKIKDS